MKILIDIVHMADVNFYKHAIKILRKRGHKVIVTVMNRGDLFKFVKSELGTAHLVGTHTKSKFLKPIYNIARLLALRNFIKEIEPTVVTSFSYYPAAAVKGLGIKSVVFHDDPEYKMQFKLCEYFANKLVIPDFLSIKGNNIIKYHSYKEWAYLQPDIFKPNYNALKKYKLKQEKYIFIREIASISLNYKNKLELDYRKIISKLVKKGLKVIVSLENKARKNEFKGAIILREPTKDFHSFLYFAKALISSGDTMVREAALLGVPAIYTGGRYMEINRELMEKGYIIPLLDEDDIVNAISIAKKKLYAESVENTTDIIVNEIENEK